MKRSKGNVNYFKTPYNFTDRFLYKFDKKQNNKSNEKKKGDFTLFDLMNTIENLREIKFNEVKDLIEIKREGKFETLNNKDINLLRLDLSKLKKVNFSSEDIKTALMGWNRTSGNIFYRLFRS